MPAIAWRIFAGENASAVFCEEGILYSLAVFFLCSSMLCRWFQCRCSKRQWPLLGGLTLQSPERLSNNDACTYRPNCVSQYVPTPTLVRNKAIAITIPVSAEHQYNLMQTKTYRLCPLVAPNPRSQIKKNNSICPVPLHLVVTSSVLACPCLFT